MKRQSSWQRFRRWLLLPIPALFLMAGTPAFAGSAVGLSLSLNYGPPPALVSYPSDLVLIPGTEVYFAPASGVDLFFYGDNWWSHRGPRWYRSYSPDGPWVIIDRRYVPGPLYRVPHDYRTVYRHGQRIPFGHWKKHAHYDRGWIDRSGRQDRWDRHDRWDRDDDHRHGRHYKHGRYDDD